MAIKNILAWKPFCIRAVQGKHSPVRDILQFLWRISINLTGSMGVRLLLEEPSWPEFSTSELVINIFSCCLELLELICRIRASVATRDKHCSTDRHLWHGIILLRCDLHENQTRHFCNLYLSTSSLIPSLSLTSEYVSYINVNSSQQNEILSPTND